MSPNFIQEQLSWAYVKAVIFRGRFDLSLPVVDRRGIDGTITDSRRNGMNRVDFQLMSTTDYAVRDDEIVYDLRVQHYNHLIIPNDAPRVLILFVMPENPDQWLAQSLDELCLRKCAFWHSVMGDEPSSNNSEKRVFVPRSNVFNLEGVQGMFQELLG